MASSINDAPRPPAHNLPAGLKDIVNDENRDSAYFSSDASSKRTFANLISHAPATLAMTRAIACEPQNAN